MLRHACASDMITFSTDAEAFAVGLLVGAMHPETQSGIMALAVMLHANPDKLVAIAHAVRMCSPELLETQRVVLIEAAGREVTE